MVKMIRHEGHWLPEEHPLNRGVMVCSVVFGKSMKMPSPPKASETPQDPAPPEASSDDPSSGAEGS
jgi:hypothetical protein